MPHHFHVFGHSEMRGPVTIDEECAAFLAGTYDELIDRLGWVRDPWTWLNRLAHGDLAALHAIADGDAGEDLGDATWQGAASFLAYEMLRLFDGQPERLRAVQREALVPLEFAWMHEPWLGSVPIRLVDDVRTVVARALRKERHHQ